MNNFEFSELLINNISLYIICLLFLLTLFFLSLKSFYNSIIDPMFMVILFSAIASAIPFFLYFTNHCELKNLVYFIFAKLAFWIGFAVFYEKNNRFKPSKIHQEERISYRLYLIFFIISILSKLISYAVLGIPLFLDNRQDIYVDAGGLAILDKIAYPSNFYCLIYSFYLINRKSILAYTYISFAILIGILGGGKGFILNICAAYFIYKYIFKEDRITIPFYMLLTILTTPILILLISGFSSNIYMALYDYLFRIVAYGDVYWYSFPNETLEHIHIENPIKHLFSGLLGPLRLINYETDGIPIGRMLYWETMPKEYHEVMGGPNARPVILFYVLFKYFGVFICYIFGNIMAFFMTHIKKYFPQSIISTVIVGFIYVTFKNIATDPVMTFNNVFSTFLFIIILIFSLFFIQRKYIIKKTSYSNDVQKKTLDVKAKTQLKFFLPILFLIISIVMTIYN